ncbi:TetR/AcrR family transcriptional regulator [Amycolatopsis thermoflava]|uniref:TetR/AcrR family transcriptional regulator n=1 Tax=Amycolatopsis thermoflava TaxID=84480 RepID=UPI0003FF8B91|nr:TetR/AcrR family transcriptional regulator [Amycolatopsis thermoflava]
MARRSGPRDGEATRAALVDAAAKLFAEQGVDGVSIRAVNTEAGLAPAAVHYHFGSKDALLNAVLLRDGEPVRERIHGLAEELAARETVPTARDLVGLLTIPYRELIERDPERAARWLAICGQLSLAHDERLLGTAPATNKLLHELVSRAYPDVPADEQELNWSIAANTLIQMTARWSWAMGGVPSQETERQLTALAEFVAGGLDHAMAVAAARSSA